MCLNMHCLALNFFHKKKEFPSAKTVITYYSLLVNKKFHLENVQTFKTLLLEKDNRVSKY